MTAAPEPLRPVKLVIWDLDETFWSGTLSEGPVRLDESRSEIVRTLNRRGIANSICSNNDPARVRERLEAAGLWEEFVFASVDWSPKGGRVAQIIEDIGLRPESVLFIDDLPFNCEEVRTAVPGIQTATPDVINGLLEHPALRGKDDGELTRLRQYRVLERKLADRRVSTSTNEAFLRSCDIHVALSDDAEGELARVFELVHRTNQLNFTKRRPEEEAFRKLLQDPECRTGYVRARDRYGDYGICGFFSLTPDGGTLVDYLFSCRVLHMGIEQFVYSILGRPALAVVGDVASTVEGDVDWITLDAEPAGPQPAASTTAPADGRAEGQGRGGRVLMMGGCDLEATAQFLGGDIVTDFSRNGPTGAVIHTEHTSILRQAASGTSEAQLAVVDRLILLDRAVFDPALFRTAYDVFVYSALMDFTQGRYRHRATGLVVPWYHLDRDATDPADWPAIVGKVGHAGVDRAFLTWFAEEFEGLGAISPSEFQADIAWLAAAVAPGARLTILNGAEVPVANEDEPDRHLRHRQMNRALDEVAAGLPNVSICDVRPMVVSSQDVASDIRHYQRQVYLRIAEEIRASAAHVTLRRRRLARTVRRVGRAPGLRRFRVRLTRPPSR